jgi:hypothetical protein
METPKDIDKAEIMMQKALTYIATLKENIDKARGLPGGDNPDGNETKIIEEVINEKKRKIPKRSTKVSDQNRRTLPRSTKYKEKNCGNNSSESESDDDEDGIIKKTYTIPRKNVLSDNLKQHKIEDTDDPEVRIVLVIYFVI